MHKLLYLLCPVIAYATAATTNTLYVTDAIGGEIYAVDIDAATSRTLTTISDTSLADMAVASPSLAYALDYSHSYIYSVNLQTGETAQVTPSAVGPINNLYAMDLANSNTAYVVGYENNTIYSVNLADGSYATAVTIEGSPSLDGIALLNPTTAFVTSYPNSKVYSVNLQTGAYQAVTPLSLKLAANSGSEGISLANRSTAYVAGDIDSNLYQVDLSNGFWSIVTPTAINGGEAAPVGLVINDTTAYVAGYATGNIYAVNLLTGDVSTLLHVASFDRIYSVRSLLQISLNGISGNANRLGRYLNENAPVDVVRSFALLDDGVKNALATAAPTRNAISTFAAQNSYMASSQALNDHLRLRRFGRNSEANRQLSTRDTITDELLVDASEQIKQPPRCANSFNGWISPFGEFAQESSQNQTPSFNLSLGGVVAGVERGNEKGNLFGIGGAYVYTHIHEGDDQGKANINQGYLIAYGTLCTDLWYFDMALWGGYYSSQNRRNISFTGVSETAKARIHGWQAAPHLEVGYNCNSCHNLYFGLEPFAAVDWAATWESGFDETGAGSYNMGQKARFNSLFRGEIGLRRSDTFVFDWGKLIFREKGSYAYQKAFLTGRITAFLIGSSGSFTVDTLTGAQNLGIIEFSMLYLSSNAKAPYVDLRAQAQLGSQFQTYQGVVEIGKNF